jgi:protein SCO1/2
MTMKLPAIFRIARCAALLLAFLLAAPCSAHASGAGSAQYDADQALAMSQAAIGRTLADLELTDAEGKPVRLAQYRGKPLLISMIFTSCYHVCPALTRHLATATEAAREVLGEDSFQVLTIGFDTAHDSPGAMRSFARAQKAGGPQWAFLSSGPETMARLVDNIGFVYFPSPRGFDHINQVTMVDRDGVIYRQVYGAAFDLPALMEPLKQLVFNQPQTATHLVASLVDRVRLFCTVYDPASGRYRFDYSLFVQIAIGALAILAVAGWLLLEARRSRRRKQSGN